MKATYFKRISVLCMFLASITLFISCGSHQVTHSPSTFDAVKDLVLNKHFMIENQWASSMSNGQPINLAGNYNSLEVMGDSIRVDLPYFGVRHSGGMLGGDGGINVDGTAENYLVQVNDTKQRIILNFEGNEQTEDFQFYIIIYGNGNVETTVTSTERSAISYQGKITGLPDKKEIY